MSDHRDVAVDFMDMTNNHRRRARTADACAGMDLVAGRHVIVGDEDADPRVARIVTIDKDGNLDLEILDGSVESHADLLARA